MFAPESLANNFLLCNQVLALFKFFAVTDLLLLNLIRNVYKKVLLIFAHLLKWMLVEKLQPSRPPSTWCQFHQLYTCAFFVQTLFRQLFLVTCTLHVRGKSCQNDVRTKNLRIKMLMKLTPDPLFGACKVVNFEVGLIVDQYTLKN